MYFAGQSGVAEMSRSRTKNPEPLDDEEFGERETGPDPPVEEEQGEQR